MVLHSWSPLFNRYCVYAMGGAIRGTCVPDFTGDAESHGDYRDLEDSDAGIHPILPCWHNRRWRVLPSTVCTDRLCGVVVHSLSYDCISCELPFKLSAPEILDVQESRPKKTRSQAVQYFFLYAFMTVANLDGLYVLTEYAHMWYITAQIPVSLALTVVGYIVTRNIFKT